MRRTAPRPIGDALAGLTREWAPPTLLGAVQEAWPGVAGPAMAEEAEPVAERDGVVTLACRSSVWAQELDLLSPELVARLNGVLRPQSISALRCVATPRRITP